MVAGYHLSNSSLGSGKFVDLSGATGTDHPIVQDRHSLHRSAEQNTWPLVCQMDQSQAQAGGHHRVQNALRSQNAQDLRPICSSDT